MTLFSYFMTLFSHISSLLILLVHINKFNIYDTPIILPLRLTLPDYRLATGSGRVALVKAAARLPA